MDKITELSRKIQSKSIISVLLLMKEILITFVINFRIDVRMKMPVEYKLSLKELRHITD